MLFLELISPLLSSTHCAQPHEAVTPTPHSSNPKSAALFRASCSPTKNIQQCPAVRLSFPSSPSPTKQRLTVASPPLYCKKHFSELHLSSTSSASPHSVDTFQTPIPDFKPSILVFIFNFLQCYTALFSAPHRLLFNSQCTFQSILS